MTIQELLGSEEFQEFFQVRFKQKVSGSTHRFYHHLDGWQEFDIGDVIIRDPLHFQATGGEGATHQGSFSGDCEIHGNFIESGRDNEEIQIELSDPTSGTFILGLHNGLSLPNAADILVGADLDIEIAEIPEDKEPSQEPPEGVDA
jgi:hypothetical protein